MRMVSTILSLMLISLTAVAGKIDLKVQSTAGDTIMSRQILEGQGNLSFKPGIGGLSFSYGSNVYGATINYRKESANGCGTRYHAFGNTAEYQVFFVADDNTTNGLSSDCLKAGLVADEPSRIVITVIEKKTGAISATSLIQK